MEDYIEKRKNNDSEFAKLLEIQELAKPYAYEIIKLRDNASLTQAQLAKLINVSEENINRWEDCEEVPPAEIQNRIANALHKPVTIVINPLVAHG